MTLEDQLLLLKNAAISTGENVQDVSIIPGAWCLVYPGHKEVFWITEDKDGERGIFKLKLKQEPPLWSREADPILYCDREKERNLSWELRARLSGRMTPGTR